LPAGDFGIDLMKETRRIFLYGETCNNNKHILKQYGTRKNTNYDLFTETSRFYTLLLLNIIIHSPNILILEHMVSEPHLLCHKLHDLICSDVASRLSYYKGNWNLSCLFIRIPVLKRLADLVNLVTRPSHVIHVC